MDEQFIDASIHPNAPTQASPDETSRRHYTGPRTMAGKSRSSMNRLSHGCCSEKNVLPHEDPAEFAFTINAWFDHYQPGDDDIAHFIVDETAHAHWLYKRASKRLQDIECRLPGDAYLWTADHVQLFALFTRYKTTYERSFRSWFKDLEAHYNRLHRREQLDQIAFARLAAVDRKWLNKKEEETAKELKVRQVVEVEIVDGQCKTSYHPTNEEVKQQAAAQSDTPLFVSRWLLFPSGVPAEYDWSNPTAIQKTTSTNAVQKMSWNRWLELTEYEKSTGTGHAGPLTSGLREN